jgi:hypothetical protein
LHHSCFCNSSTSLFFRPCPKCKFVNLSQRFLSFTSLDVELILFHDFVVVLFVLNVNSKEPRCQIVPHGSPHSRSVKRCLASGFVRIAMFATKRLLIRVFFACIRKMINVE